MSRFSFITAICLYFFYSMPGFECGCTYMKCTDTKLAPRPCGAYCSAIRVNDTLHLSGVIGIDRTTNKLADGGIKHETEVVFGNIKTILEECGSSFDKVATVTIYLDDLNNYDPVNALYATYFLHPFPARSIVEVRKLPEGAKIQVQLTAIITDEGRFADFPV